MLSLLDSDFKLLFFGGARSSSPPLAHVLVVAGPESLLKKEFIFDICNETHEEQQQQHSNAHVWHRASVQYLWPTKKVLFSAQRSSAVLFVSHVICTFLLAFERLSPNVWETWMILTRKRLLVDIFVTRRLLKSFAFCKFACVNFEPWFLVNSSRISSS